MNISLTSIINNEGNFYEGDLRFYFKLLFRAPNVNHPYHNFRHMCHITYETYDALKYYRDQFSKREARGILIGSTFHDWGHTGISGNDAVNIAIAKKAVRQHLLPEDFDLLPIIDQQIDASEYPHIDCGDSLAIQIIRDADMSQTFSDIWLQQVIFGLSKEQGISPLELLKKQEDFLANHVRFATDWAKEKFEPKRVAKIQEVKGLLEIVG